jgi:hypothetical protein
MPSIDEELTQADSVTVKHSVRIARSGGVRSRSSQAGVGTLG